MFPKTDTLPFPPSAISKQPTLLRSGKLPAVTHILFFQTACKMMSHQCIVAGPVSAKNMYTTRMLRGLERQWMIAQMVEQLLCTQRTQVQIPAPAPYEITL